MTEPTPSDAQQPVTPSRRDKLRPLELVGFSGVLAVFAGLVVLLVSRTSPEQGGGPNFVFAGIATGIVFIIVLMTVALLGLGGKPSEEDLEARKDLQHPEDGKSTWH